VRRLGVIAVVMSLALLAAGTADARWLGSTLSGRVNVNFGCESAPGYDPITGQPTLFTVNQSSCTYQHAGYIGSNRFTSLVPGNGRIVRFRVKSGRNPARLRLTILQGSSRITAQGGEIQGTYTCCTARRVLRAFRPRARRTTTRRVNVRVFDDRDLQRGIHTTDIIAISAVGRGSLPLRAQGTSGSYSNGSAFARFWYPRTEVGDPRVEGGTFDGLDVMLQWDWRRRR
jgi:hypothetical protein